MAEIPPTRISDRRKIVSESAGHTEKQALLVTSSKPRLACPFSKKYELEDIYGASCFGQGFETAHRVKEHLNRAHGPRTICPRCQTIFKTQDDMNEHLNQEEICSKKPPLIDHRIRYMTLKQHQDLNKRKRTGLSNEDQWNRVYLMLFPSETELPSPYLETASQRWHEALAYEQHLRYGVREELKSMILMSWETSNPAAQPELKTSLKRLMVEVIESGLYEEAFDKAVSKFKKPRVANLDTGASHGQKLHVHTEPEGVKTPAICLAPVPNEHAEPVSLRFPPVFAQSFSNTTGSDLVPSIDDSITSSLDLESEAVDFPEWLDVNFISLPDLPEGIQMPMPEPNRAMPWSSSKDDLVANEDMSAGNPSHGDES